MSSTIRYFQQYVVWLYVTLQLPWLSSISDTKLVYFRFIYKKEIWSHYAIDQYIVYRKISIKRRVPPPYKRRGLELAI